MLKIDLPSDEIYATAGSLFWETVTGNRSLAFGGNSQKPLLAGELVNADQGGVCASMNKIIAALPRTIPNSYVISSAGCTDSRDNLHFNAEGYRKLGKRYAAKMLSVMGYNVSIPE